PQYALGASATVIRNSDLNAPICATRPRICSPRWIEIDYVCRGAQPQPCMVRYAIVDSARNLVAADSTNARRNGTGRVQVHSTCRGTVPKQGVSVTGLSEKPSGADLNTAARGDRPRFGEDATWVEIDRARRGAMPQHRMIMLGAVAIRQANLSVALNT